MKVKASRRMWLRRILRAGDMVAPILSPLREILLFFFGGVFPAIMTTVVSLGLFGIVYAYRYSSHLETAATSAEIREYMKKSDCLRTTIPTLSRKDGGPLTYQDMVEWETECVKQTANVKLVAEQKKAMASK